MRSFLGTTAIIALTSLAACEGARTIPTETKPGHSTIQPDKSLESNQAFDLNAADTTIDLVSDKSTAAITRAGDGARLEIKFQVTEGLSKVSLVSKSPINWGDLTDKNIAFDVSNSSDVSTQLYIGLVDANGKFQNRSASIPAKSHGTYYFFLDGPTRHIDGGMRELPDPWTNDAETMLIWRWGARAEGEFDWSEVVEVNFFVRGAIREKEAIIENIRVRENAAIPTTYLKNISDRFGQSALSDFPIKVYSDADLYAAAQAELKDLIEQPGFPDRSRFGGWNEGPQLESTGYFRVEKVDGKWWLVDPDGHLFFSHGVANVRMANSTTLTGIDFRDDSVRTVDESEVTPEDSIGIVDVSNEVRNTRFVSSQLRRNMFEWLPDYDHPLAEHYSYRRSVHMGPMESGETFSFYRANLERRYGDSSPQSYLDTWKQVTLDRMKSWGFTSFGNWVDPMFYANEQVPYFANGWIIGDFQTLSSGHEVWTPMPDFFDPEFKRRTRATIAVVAEEVQATPWCVGIFIDNEKSWGFRDGTVEQRYGIILDALSRKAQDSPAKSAFSNTLKGKHGSIATLNAAWNTNFLSWEEFDAEVRLEEYTEAMIADLSLLLEQLADEYFRTVHDTLEEHLPEHLYMGARMASWGMPDEVVKAALKHSDVMSFNIYHEGMQEDAWAFLSEIDKPVVIGEFHIGAISDSGLFHPGLVIAADQSDRARMYKEYMQTVTRNPYLVGAHWFQYTDSPLTGRAFDGENYNVGFVSVTDIPYPEMVEAARDVMRNVYPDRYAN